VNGTGRREPRSGPGDMRCSGRDILALARGMGGQTEHAGHGSMYGVSSAAPAALRHGLGTPDGSAPGHAGDWERRESTPGGRGLDGTAGGPLALNFSGTRMADGTPFAGWPKEGAKNSVNQKVYRLLLPETVMNPPIEWIGEGFCGQSLEQVSSPETSAHRPGPEGAPIKMALSAGRLVHFNHDRHQPVLRMYQHPNLEFARESGHSLGQSETGFGRHRPASMQHFEREDICEWGAPGGYGANNAGRQSSRHQFISTNVLSPSGESKSDYDIYVEAGRPAGFQG